MVNYRKKTKSQKQHTNERVKGKKRGREIAFSELELKEREKETKYIEREKNPPETGEKVISYCHAAFPLLVF